MSGKLYKQDGESVGYWDVVEWIVYNYPEDIFVVENYLWCEIRDRARIILMKRLEEKKTIKKAGNKNV